jgi:hypothetical protein
VDIVLPECVEEPFSFDTVVSALRIELAQEGVLSLRRVTAPEDGERARIELVAECQPTLSSLLIRIYTPNEPTAVRAMDLSDLPLALRPRGVALATAELARSVWLRSAGQAAAPEQPSAGPVDSIGGRSVAAVDDMPAPSSSSSGSPRAVPSLPSVVRPSPSAVPGLAVTQPYGQESTTALPPTPVFDLSGSLGVRVYFPDATALFGPRASLRFHRFRLGVDALAGRRVDPLGEVWLMAVAGLVGLDAWTHTEAGWRLRMGPRASAGVAMASAGDWAGLKMARAQETYFDAALEAGAEVRIAARWAAFLDVEMGGARGLAVYADQRAAGTIGGWLLGGRVGLSGVP